MTSSMETLNTFDVFKMKVLEEYTVERMEAAGIVPTGNLDDTLTRYLTARNYEEKEALKLFKSSMKWREDNNIGLYTKQMMIPMEKMEAVRKYMPQGCHGVDKEGNVLFFEHLGFLDTDSMAKVCKLEDVLTAHIQKCEYQMHQTYPNAARKFGKSMTKSTVIYNLAGIGLHTFKKVVYQFIKEVAVINQDHYPETLNRVFIVNTPLFFYGTWKLIEVFLNENSRKKVTILGKNYQPTLLQYISRDQLPKELGGTCECFPGQPHGIYWRIAADKYDSLGGCMSSKTFTKTHFWNDMDKFLNGQDTHKDAPQ